MYCKIKQMKITVTGSLGHISKPLAERLLQKGHSVTIITSQAARQKDIEAMGAVATIGSLTDADFLAQTFTGADIVYCMEPPANFFDPATDITAYWLQIANAYAGAITQSGVQKVVHLSSIGAHTCKGNGLLAAHYMVENIFKALPQNVSVKFMRPVGFYYNMFAFIPVIKKTGSINQNYGGDEKEPWVSPLDIAQTVAAAMETGFEGRSVQYIASDECSPNELVTILGNAIGMPQLQWTTVTDDQFYNGLINAGMNPASAKGLTEMNAARRGGALYKDYFHNKPELGAVKLSAFAKEFAAVYMQQTQSI